jgi:hypothetical protein
MKQQDYHNSISVDAGAAEAFEAISRVPAWWAKNFEGYSESLHDIFTVRFGETFVTFELTEFVPNKRVVWHVTDCYLHFIKDRTEWKGTSVIWDISREGDKTRIDMTHRGLVPACECFENCQRGWNRHITESLYKYLTENAGMPA